MNLFYTPQITTNNTHYTLSEQESGHAIRVLRMKNGDALFSTDGRGHFYHGVIITDHPKKCLVKINTTHLDPAKQSFYLSIAIAPTKMTDRLEWFLEKVTEIGCSEITPIICQHSERTVIKKDRLYKVLASSMKQCLKSQLPILNDATDYKSFLSYTQTFNGQKFIGHIPELSTSTFPPKQSQGIGLNKIYVKGNGVLVIIGPEGGFSNEEIKLAESKNIIPISLGKSRLRVETAGLMACAMLNSINN